MRRIYLLTFLFALVVTGMQSQGIDFYQGNYKDALEQALEEDKLVFVDAYAVWCGPCKRMSRLVFPLPEVGEIFNKNFVNLKIDMERGQGLDFGKSYPVRAYPTFFFLDGEGNVVHKMTGGRSAEGLIAEANKALKKYDGSAKFKKLYTEGDRCYETVYGYVKYLNNRGESSLRIANDYLRKQNNLKTKENVDFLLIAATEIDSKIFDQFLSVKKDVIKHHNKIAFEDRVVESALNTYKKSLEYESPDLQKQANKTVKKHAKSRYSEYIAECAFIQNMNSSEASLFVPAATDYFELVIKENEYEQKKLCAQLLKKFGSNEAALKLSTEIAKNTVHLNPGTENCLLVSRTYIKRKMLPLAIEWTEKALDMAGTDKQARQKAQQQLDFLKAK